MSRALTALALLAAAPAFGADPGSFDWPQWRGADRTGLSKETGLLKDWPTGGPKQVWKITGLGEGYSTAAVSAGRIYLLGTKGTKEHVFCLSETDGTPVWDVAVGQRSGGGGFPGPRGTPTVDGSHLYAVTSDGTLSCVATDTGTVKWQKNYRKDFGGKPGRWEYAESPLVDGDLVIGTPGSDSAALVAFKKATGEVVWKTTVAGLTRKPPDPKGKQRTPRDYATAGYSSPVVAEIGGVKQYVQFLDGGVVGVGAADGKLLWHYEEPANEVANISTPIVRADFVFAASSYWNGAGQAKITKASDGFKADQTYFISKFQNHHGGVVLVKDHLYGTNNTSLLSVDFKTGKEAWGERSVGKGSVTYADGHIYARGEDGKVALVEANPAKYVEKGMFTQPDQSGKKTWPHPVVANGKLYLRDWDALFCYDVKGK
jgi:outer membrane protein assembly factor BamB